MCAVLCAFQKGCMVKTKIIATLGPASNNETMLRKMYRYGLDVVRLNFSHGTKNGQIEGIKLVRAMNRKMRRAIKILQDLEGYRVRIGKLKEPMKLQKNARIYFVQENIMGDKQVVPFDYFGSLELMQKGMMIYVDDGKIRLQIEEVEKNRLRVKVLNSCILNQHKGINIPDVRFEFRGVTEKDNEDVQLGISYKVDFIAQSFVRTAEDIRMLRSIVKPRHPECKLIAKIENQEAVDNINTIIEEADLIMIARGDLGVCVPIYKVPVIQKEIITKCIKKNKPVIVATQMLESMKGNDIPTRAEVSDVANALLDGALYVMLSGETAVGNHPHKVVDIMNKIIKNTEDYQGRTNSNRE